MAVRFHPHARERMGERGATEDEVRATVEQKANSFRRSLDALAFDVTSRLIASGEVSITGPSR